MTGCVDTRTVTEILASDTPNDPVQIFRMPEGWYAQEPRFIPRRAKDGEVVAEDDGYLLTYAFNESQLCADGEVPPDNDDRRRAKSELWIIDAKYMKTVVGRVELPQRVPYGLHGSWFPEEDILNQRPVETIRSLEEIKGKSGRESGLWMGIRDKIERFLN